MSSLTGFVLRVVTGAIPGGSSGWRERSAGWRRASRRVARGVGCVHARPRSCRGVLLYPLLNLVCDSKVIIAGVHALLLPRNVGSPYLVAESLGQPEPVLPTSPHRRRHLPRATGPVAFMVTGLPLVTNVVNLALHSHTPQCACSFDRSHNGATSLARTAHAPVRA